jgi:adenine deaminase
MILSFVGLAGVPDLGLTELGLIDTAQQAFTPLVLDVVEGRANCRCPSHAYPVHHLMDEPTAAAIDLVPQA